VRWNRKTNNLPDLESKGRAKIRSEKKRTIRKTSFCTLKKGGRGNCVPPKNLSSMDTVKKKKMLGRKKGKKRETEEMANSVGANAPEKGKGRGKSEGCREGSNANKRGKNV